jgi:DNA-binding winged helix-turn-helix (wHTH) protein
MSKLDPEVVRNAIAAIREYLKEKPKKFIETVCDVGI